jgi:glycosyltransferase involved in cell wall biosynthesis
LSGFVISAFIPVRNGSAWIRESLQSLLDQTFQPAEILVADDASSDGTPEIAESLGSPLIRVLRNETHQGISTNCNEMIRQAKFRYLARMDADDIALPDRFKLQMARFKTSDVSVLGTAARRFGAADTFHTNPLDDAGIRAKLGLSCPFVNPTVIFDREPLGDAIFYDPNVPFGEDYEQFVRLRHRAKFANLPRVTLRWRLHKTNAGSDPGSLRKQSQTVSEVRTKLWEECGIVLDEPEKQALDQLVFLPLPEISDSAHLLSAFRKAVLHPDPEALWAPQAALRAMLLGHWDYYCRVRARDSKGVLPIWYRGVRSLGGGIGLVSFAKIALKSILRS